jgi:serine/threonine-protein kinase RsbW
MDKGPEIDSTGEYGRFTVADLGQIRALVARVAAAAGLSVRDRGNLVIAVDEIVANAIVHAGGRGVLLIGRRTDGVVVEVSDDGPGLPGKHPLDDPPPADALGGRGLWIARQLCPDIAFIERPDGLTVTMFMPTATTG